MGVLKEAATDADDKPSEAKGKSEPAKGEKKHKHKAKHPAATPAPSEGADDGADAAPDQEADASDEQPAGDSEQDQSPPQGDDSGDSDEGEQQAQPGQQEGAPQQGQGPSPVPSPQAPGAGDTTSGGADTPDSDDQGPPQGQGDTGGDETPGDDTAAGTGSENSLPQIPMSPALKEEYQRANEMLMQELYGAPNDAAAKGVIGGLAAEGPQKVKSAIHLSLVVTTSIIKKLGVNAFPPQLVLPFTKDVVTHVMDLGQQVKQVQYSDQESVAILGATLQGIMHIVGVNNGQVKKLGHMVGRKTILAHMTKNRQALAMAKQGMDNLHASMGPQQGAPQEAGPQTGAPAGSTAAPTSGAPPTQGPPPATLAQGAAAAGMSEQGGQ